MSLSLTGWLVLLGIFALGAALIVLPRLLARREAGRGDDVEPPAS